MCEVILLLRNVQHKSNTEVMEGLKIDVDTV